MIFEEFSSRRTKNNETEENLQARIRGNILMTIANKENDINLDKDKKD